jgi:TPP-dependent pyruvate/acetoin dehydrogenase alpha subunit
MDTNIIELYRVMSLIRKTEEALLDLFAKNELSGTTHTSIGQEANAVGIVKSLDLSKNAIWSSHRCHGHFLGG